MKNIIFLIMLLIIYGAADAQFISGVKMSSGISISGLEYNYGTEDDLLGPLASLEISYLEHSFWRINSKISYCERGSKNKIIATSENGTIIHEYEFRSFYDYFMFNTTFEIGLKTDIVNPNISIGPRIDYLIRPQYDSDYYSYINYGFDLGIGLDKQITNKLVLGLDFIWNYQMNDVYKLNDSKITPTGGYDITLGLEYRLLDY